MGWTQPICASCWDARNPGRPAARIPDSDVEPETCCHCGELTTSGIYVREDPSTVPFPTAG